MSAAREEAMRPLILLADDDETNRVLLRQALEVSDFSVVEAENGARAVEAFVGLPDVTDVLVSGPTRASTPRASRVLTASRITVRLTPNSCIRSFSMITVPGLFTLTCVS